MKNFVCLFLLFSFHILFLLSCSSKKDIFLAKARDAVKDEHWIDDHTLQLVVPGKKYPGKAPISVQRKFSCKAAQKSVRRHFQKKYPKVNAHRVKTDVRYTLYKGDGTCQLIVWYHQKNLKKTSLNSP